MPFYLRKSIKAGPIRFNLSKSGIGVSTGIPGFRIGTGPGGNYIHMGRNGVYYRSTWVNKDGRRSTNKASSFNPLPSEEVSSTQMTEIKSADVQAFQDVSSSSLLAEINKKYKIPDYWLPVSLLCSLSLIVLLSLLVQEVPFVDQRLLFLFIGCILFSIGVAFLLYELNQLQKTTILFYTMDTELENAYQAVHQAFKNIQSCHRKWFIREKGDVYGAYKKKLNSGANSLITRSLILPSTKLPRWIKTNIEVPSIPVGAQILYFFPDRLLVQDGKRFGAISFSDITISVSNKPFIEEEPLPVDAQVVGKKWKFPNKDGGPDKRFRNNYEIPLVVYNEVEIKSSQGLNVCLQLSKPNCGVDFAISMRDLSIALQTCQAKRNLPSDEVINLSNEIVELYSIMGYPVRETIKRTENKIDFIISGKYQEKWVVRLEIQELITPEIILDFKRFLDKEKPTQATLITSGNISPSVRNMITNPEVVLLGFNQLQNLLDTARSKLTPKITTKE